jgi:two-component system NarL family sensor kinase
VQLQQENKKLTITVEDNGKGFSQTKASDGIGLTNIKSRLSLLKGTLEIDSTETMGTSVFIELYLEK